jgi:hypothetical protein
LSTGGQQSGNFTETQGFLSRELDGVPEDDAWAEELTEAELELATEALAAGLVAELPDAETEVEGEGLPQLSNIKTYKEQVKYRLMRCIIISSLGDYKTSDLPISVILFFRQRKRFPSKEKTVFP